MQTLDRRVRIRVLLLALPSVQPRWSSWPWHSFYGYEAEINESQASLLSIQVVSHFPFPLVYKRIVSSVRDDRESVPIFAHTRSPSDSTQPVHAFASTSSDVAQPSPQVQNSTPDVLPPRYTLDASQLQVQGNNNPIASKFTVANATPRNSG